MEDLHLRIKTIIVTGMQLERVEPSDIATDEPLFGDDSRLDFDSVDGLPVRILVAIVAPERSTGDHLKALARVSRLLRSERVREELIAADSPSAALQIALERDEMAG